MIDTYAFQNCIKLAEIYLPASISSIAYNSFEGSKALSTIVVNADSTYFKSENSVIYSKDGKSLGFHVFLIDKQDTVWYTVIEHHFSFQKESILWNTSMT